MTPAEANSVKNLRIFLQPARRIRVEMDFLPSR